MSDFVICRSFKLILISADVKKVRKFFRTKLYASVTIGKNKATRKKTPTDKRHKTNPKWNHTIEYVIASTDVQNPVKLDFLIELYDDRAFGDKRVSSVSRTMHELFCLGYNNMREGNMTRISLPVVNGGGVTKGVVTFDYIFGEEESVKKLSLVKKLANIGTSVAVKTAVMSTTGFYLPTPILIFREPNIVSSKKAGCFRGILSKDSLVEVIVEAGQYV